MVLDTYTIVYLIVNFFNVLILHRLIISFYEKRKSNNLLYLFLYLAYYVVTSGLYLFVDIPIIALVANFAFIFGLSLCFDTSMPSRFLNSVYILIFCIIPEIAIAAITGYFKYSIFNEGSYSNSLGLVAIGLTSYMEALLIYNFKSVRRNRKINGSVWLASVLIPLISFVLHAYIVQSEATTQKAVIVSTVLIFILNITAFYLYDSLAANYIKISEASIIEKEKEFYYQQCQLIQNSAEEVRTLRHDLHNQLVVISDLIEKNQQEEALMVVKRLSGKTKNRNLYSFTGNIPIDSIINYKLQNAEQEQIQIETNIAVPADIEFNSVDCVMILGNILDNSLCALKQVDCNHRYLKLKVVYDKERLLIQCINPYETKIMYENGNIISSKKDRKHHGYGLKSIKTTVEMYDGYMEINHENKVFLIDIVLYVPNYCKK